MVKTKTLIKRRAYSKSIQSNKAPKQRKMRSGVGIDHYDPTQSLIDEDRIGRAIWECLKNGDSEGIIEIIQIHLEACNKTKRAKEASLPKTTLYHSLRSKNPTIKTLAKLVHTCL